MSDYKPRKWAIGVLFAGLAGYLAGILTAPKSGKETRKDLRDNANRAVSEAEKQLKKLHSEITVVAEDAKQVLSGKTDKAKKDMDQAMNVVKDKQQKIKQLLSALRDGGSADNPELKKAIKEGSAALDHLKKFLK